MILCDTNILIDVYRSNLKTIQIVNQIGQDNLAISHVTSGELLFGARNKTELQHIRKDFDYFTVFPLTSSISFLAIELINTYSLSHKLDLPDSLIAATAITYNLELFTLNQKDFKFIKNLDLYDFNPKV